MQVGTSLGFRFIFLSLELSVFISLSFVNGQLRNPFLFAKVNMLAKVNMTHKYIPYNQNSENFAQENNGFLTLYLWPRNKRAFLAFVP